MNNPWGYGSGSMAGGGLGNSTQQQFGGWGQSLPMSRQQSNLENRKQANKAILSFFLQGGWRNPEMRSQFFGPDSRLRFPRAHG